MHNQNGECVKQIPLFIQDSRNEELEDLVVSWFKSHKEYMIICDFDKEFSNTDNLTCGTFIINVSG